MKPFSGGYVISITWPNWPERGNMKKLFVLSSVLLLTLVAEAGRNQNREKRQEARIKQGVQSGELTKHEARRLQHGQNKIDRMQEKANADGVVTAEEKVKLEKMQDRQNRKIYRQKHDGQSRDDKNGAQPAVPATPAEPATSSDSQ